MLVLDLAPDGVYIADGLLAPLVSPYLTLSALPLKKGGILSVALALKSPSPGVTRHPCPAELGLSSEYTFRDHLT